MNRRSFLNLLFAGFAFKHLGPIWRTRPIPWTYGAIDRSAVAFWRNQGVSAGFEDTQLTLKAMQDAWDHCERYYSGAQWPSFPPTVQ